MSHKQRACLACGGRMIYAWFCDECLTRPDIRQYADDYSSGVCSPPSYGVPYPPPAGWSPPYAAAVQQTPAPSKPSPNPIKIDGHELKVDAYGDFYCSLCHTTMSGPVVTKLVNKGLTSGLGPCPAAPKPSLIVYQDYHEAGHVFVVHKAAPNIHMGTCLCGVKFSSVTPHPTSPLGVGPCPQQNAKPGWKTAGGHDFDMVPGYNAVECVACALRTSWSAANTYPFPAPTCPSVKSGGTHAPSPGPVTGSFLYLSGAVDPSVQIFADYGPRYGSGPRRYDLCSGCDAELCEALDGPGATQCFKCARGRGGRK